MKTCFKNPFCFCILFTLIVFTACHTNQNNNAVSGTSGPKKGISDTLPGSTRVNRPGLLPTPVKAPVIPPVKSDLPPNASKFLTKSNEACTYEIQLSQLAQAKTQTPNARNFATAAVVADMNIIAKLSAIAASDKLLLTSRLNPDHQKHVESLSKLNGSDFDKKYISAIVNEREEIVNSYKDAAATMTPKKIRIFAGQTLPLIEANLAAAKKANVK
jgi:predicted outer membrane protein